MTAPPLTPDADTARRWAEQELTDPVYHERRSLLERLLDWVLELFARAEQGARDLDPVLTALVVVAVVAAVAVIALLVTGPVRTARRARASVAVFVDDTRSAAELRASADAMAAGGDYTGAVLDRFRAIVRSLSDRAILPEQLGRTAHEAVEQAGTRFPDAVRELRAAGALFDAVCYGHATATAQDDAGLRALDQRLSATRPTGPAGPTAPASPAPAASGGPAG